MPPSSRLGLVSAFSAFLIWGLLPLFWKQLSHVAAIDVIAYRIIWTTIFAGVVLAATRQLHSVANLFTDRRRFAFTLAASFFISLNGLTFVWGVTHDRVSEVSLGYYINPLLNALLGAVVLKERTTPMQTIAIAIALLGVSVPLYAVGALPWVSLVLAMCFGMYGLIRKLSPAEALPGLCGEMLLATPIALGWLALRPPAPFDAFINQGIGTSALLILSGIATAVPLVLFAFGARRIPYTTVGLLMYTTPTLQLLLAVAVYDEPFTWTQGLTFGLIWLAIALYAWGSRSRSPVE
ncbi:MAG: EamA family transporter RarD [Myxococcota bacterium]